LETVMSPQELKFFKACKWARDQMAHARPVGLADLKGLSDWWEVLRTNHAAGIEDWDRPGARKTLAGAVPLAAGSSSHDRGGDLLVDSTLRIPQEPADPIDLSADQSAAAAPI